VLGSVLTRDDEGQGGPGVAILDLVEQGLSLAAGGGHIKEASRTRHPARNQVK
jgi:hypothetical protein